MTEIVEESTSEPVRRLVTVQRITDLNAIAGKDRIELANVLGWHVVVKKGEFKIGQLVAYHEVDSFVPTAGPKALPIYAFLDDKAKDCIEEDVAAISAVSDARGTEEQAEAAMGHRRARIRVMKMGDAYSHGFVSPLLEGEPRLEGADLTAGRNVIKYEPPTKGQPGFGRGVPPEGLKPWPSFAPSKTDEERLQSVPRLLEEFRGRAVYVTLKVDGSSMTVIKRHDGEIAICSRNHRRVPVVPELVPAGSEAALDPCPPTPKRDAFYDAAFNLGIVAALPPGYCVQGELAGPGLNGNHAGFKDVRFYVFNVFRYFDDESAPELLGFKKARGFCKDRGLLFAPVVQSGWLIDERHTIKDLINVGLGHKAPNDNPAEGVVIRPMEPAVSTVLRGRRLSCKVIDPEYELRT